MFRAQKFSTLDPALRETLSGNPYWKHLCIIQEILLGTTEIILYFEHDSISWHILHVALGRLRQCLKTLAPEPSDKGYLKIYDLSVAVEHGGAAGLDMIRDLLMSRQGSSSTSILRRLLGMA